MISFAIPVCNELEEIQLLLNNIFENINENDEVIVLFDKTHGTDVVESYLSTIQHPQYTWHSISNTDNDFSKLKNNFINLCTQEWIIQLDADEIPSDDFWLYIREILRDNISDSFYIPRRNIVKGITIEHIKLWKWNITMLEGQELINYPDYQHRVFKNNKNIRWVNKVHEKLNGYHTYSILPDIMYLTHIKNIERQERQNQYYNTL